MNNRIQATVLQLDEGKHAAEANRAAFILSDGSAGTRPMSKSPSLVESEGPLILQSDKAHDNGAAATAQAGAKHACSFSSNSWTGRVLSGKACGTGNVRLVKLSGTTQVGLPV